MDEPSKPEDELLDESLAEVPPMPAEASAPACFGVTFGTATLLTAGAGALLLLGSAVTPTAGATRSSRLQWEQRQEKIEAALQACGQEVQTHEQPCAADSE